MLTSVVGGGGLAGRTSAEDELADAQSNGRSSSEGSISDANTEQVFALDATLVAAQLGCSARELLDLLHNGEEAAFPVRLGRVTSDSITPMMTWHSNLAYAPPVLPRARVRRALISTVFGEGADEESVHEAPELLALGAHPIVLHLLRQLADAGIEEVVLVLSGPKGAAIRQVIENSPMPRVLRIRFCELAMPPSNGEGMAHSTSVVADEQHARSLLAARGELEPGGEPFLLASSDHCWESALVRHMAHEAELCAHIRGAVLTSETHVSRDVMVPSPLSPMRVRVGPHGLVRAIGSKQGEQTRSLPVAAGLFLLDPVAFFAALDACCHGDCESAAARSCSLQGALSLLAAQRALAAVAACGSLQWVSSHNVALSAQARIDALEAQERARKLSPPPSHASHAAVAPVLPRNREREVATQPPLSPPAPRLKAAAEQLLARPLLTDEAQPEGSADEDHATISEAPSLLHLPMLPSGIDTVSISTAPEPPGRHQGIRALHDASWLAAELPGQTELEDSLLVELERNPRLDRATIELKPAPDVDTLRLTTTMRAGAPVHLQMTLQRSVPPLGWAILCVGLLCMSSSELGFRLLGDDVSLLVRLAWRFQVASLYLLPWACVRIVSSKNVRATLVRKQHWLLLACAGAGWWYHFLTFCASLYFIPAPMALLFNNLVPLLLLIARVVRCAPLTLAEAGGALLAFGGSIVLALSGSEHTQRSAPSSAAELPIAGTLIAASGALGGVAYMLACKRLRPLMEPIVQMALICSIAWVLMFPVLFALRGSAFAHLGLGEGNVFGWLSRDKWARALCASFVCEIMGNLFVLLALKYLSPLAVAVTTLLSPVVAAAEGLLVGEPAPNLVAWIGMLITLGGTAAVIVGTSTSTTTVGVDIAA